MLVVAKLDPTLLYLRPRSMLGEHLDKLGEPFLMIEMLPTTVSRCWSLWTYAIELMLCSTMQHEINAATNA